MAKNEKTCFVIMRFAAPYEERCERIYKPAIEAAGLVPHLAGGPGTDKITLEIEEGIRNAHICLADISEDNLNVWYELGFAYACNKQVVAVSDKGKRPANKLPFDIKDKKVIFYESIVDSSQHACKGFQAEITESAKAKAAKAVAPIVGGGAIASSQLQGGAKVQKPEGWNPDMEKVFREIAKSTMERHSRIDKDALQKLFPNPAKFISSLRKLEEARLISAKLAEISRDADLGIRERANLFSVQPTSALRNAPKTAYGLTQRGVEFVLKCPSMLD